MTCNLIKKHLSEWRIIFFCSLHFLWWKENYIENNNTTNNTKNTNTTTTNNNTNNTTNNNTTTTNNNMQRGICSILVAWEYKKREQTENKLLYSQPTALSGAGWFTRDTDSMRTDMITSQNLTVLKPEATRAAVDAFILIRDLTDQGLVVFCLQNKMAAEDSDTLPHLHTIFAPKGSEWAHPFLTYGSVSLE